jgi:hypothetical protein
VGTSSPARIVSVGADVGFPALAGTWITWTAVASGGTAGPLQFQFVRLNEATGVWTVVRQYSSDNRFTWYTTNADSGDYSLQVWVRSNGSAAAYEGWGSTGSLNLRPQ